MRTPLTIAAINTFRNECEAEKNKQVRVSTMIQVDYTPLEKIPDISLDYIVGGGWQLTFDYRIVGGPDNGKRITLVPWRPKWSLEGMHKKYNGTHEEAENSLGYTARPAIHYHETLHISTIMFIRGMLTVEREHLHAQELDNMYKKFHKEQDSAIKIVEREDVFDDYRGPDNPNALCN